jgi:hypothetical protein
MSFLDLVLHFRLDIHLLVIVLCRLWGRFGSLLLATALGWASFSIAVGLSVLALALAWRRSLLGRAFNDGRAGVKGLELGLQSTLEAVQHTLAGDDGATIGARSGLQRD